MRQWREARFGYSFIMFIVCHFFALRGEKMTHKELNMTSKRKSCEITDRQPICSR